MYVFVWISWEVPVLPHSRGHQTLVHWAGPHRESVPAPLQRDVCFTRMLCTGASVSETGVDELPPSLGHPRAVCSHSQLTMPSPMPEYLNVHYICESASRLLFLSMHWARSIPAFQALG